MCQTVTAAASDEAIGLVSLPAAFCRSTVGVCSSPEKTIHGQKNPNRLSLSPFAPRFLLENFYLDQHVRYIVTIYPVVILWLTGTLSCSSSPGDQIYIFAGIVQQYTPVQFF